MVWFGFLCDKCGNHATIAVRELYDDGRNEREFGGVSTFDLNVLMGPEHRYCLKCYTKALPLALGGAAAAVPRSPSPLDSATKA